MNKNPGWLGYIGDEILPNYIGIIISHHKDPYKPTSIMESNKFFFSWLICFNLFPFKDDGLDLLSNDW